MTSMTSRPCLIYDAITTAMNPNPGSQAPELTNTSRARNAASLVAGINWTFCFNLCPVLKSSWYCHCGKGSAVKCTVAVHCLAHKCCSCLVHGISLVQLMSGNPPLILLWCSASAPLDARQWSGRTTSSATWVMGVKEGRWKGSSISGGKTFELWLTPLISRESHSKKKCWAREMDRVPIKCPIMSLWMFAKKTDLNPTQELYIVSQKCFS